MSDKQVEISGINVSQQVVINIGIPVQPPSIALGRSRPPKQSVIDKDIPVQRRPRRAVVMIDHVSPPGTHWRTLTVYVPRWREHEAILLSEELFPEQLRPGLRKGSVLTATVNADAEKSEDLYFEDFRMTPDEDLNSEPA